jgi:hypothetical protein
MKISEIYSVYTTLNTAKLNKMENADKFTVIKALRVIKPIAKSHEEFVQDAAQRLKPATYDADLELAQKYEREGDKSGISQGEYNKALATIVAYRKDTADCIREQEEKEESLTIPSLTEEALGKFLESNPDLQVKDILLVQDLFTA